MYLYLYSINKDTYKLSLINEKTDTNLSIVFFKFSEGLACSDVSETIDRLVSVFSFIRLNLYVSLFI
ncbi:hypothetical protein, partial [Francisella tularensis]|uniref:hypothetical protein n=1 Tax=Francisella tularensis TaxID=263 RepID=UPI001F2DE151